MVIEISSCRQGWGLWGITGMREHSRGEDNNVLTLNCGGGYMDVHTCKTHFITCKLCLNRKI